MDSLLRVYNIKEVHEIRVCYISTQRWAQSPQSTGRLQADYHSLYITVDCEDCRSQ